MNIYPMYILLFLQAAALHEDRYEEKRPASSYVDQQELYRQMMVEDLYKCTEAARYASEYSEPPYLAHLVAVAAARGTLERTKIRTRQPLQAPSTFG